MRLEVWHGGIPDNSRPTSRDVERISDKPFSISWPLWVEQHMSVSPDLIVHVHRSTGGVV
jgi:hypothetical protein